MRLVRLQMLETRTYPDHVAAALADGDSLRCYPACRGDALARIEPQVPLASAWGAQLLTGFSRTTRDALVGALGWQEIADLLVCAEEAGRGRPYPDMVLHALLRLRVDDVAVELEAIWRTGSLFVGHTCQVAGPRDLFTAELAGDLVVVRDETGTLRAFNNVCRHRGSIAAVEDHGREQRLVCPYHRWTYGLSGELLGCPGAPEGFDRERSGLRPVAVREVAGLVFVSLPFLPGEPLDFEGVLERFISAASIQGLDRAKVVAVREFVVAANWKLVWENNRECFHCDANHPGYVRTNFDTDDPVDVGRSGELERAISRHLQAVGLPTVARARAPRLRRPSRVPRLLGQALVVGEPERAA